MNINQLQLEHICDELQGISARLDAINVRMFRETQVMEAELNERRAKGLTGRAAIIHYNEYMRAHGLLHLIVKDV